MINIQRKVIAFLNDENGPTAVEYAVMVALIIVVSIAAITTLGTKVSSTFSSTASKITTTASQQTRKSPHFYVNKPENNNSLADFKNSSNLS